MANDIKSPEDLELILKDQNPTGETGRDLGVLNDPDNKFVFNKAPAEIVFPNNADDLNTYIVFGRDRPAGWRSGVGYGPRGHNKCSSIDIVVGRLSGVKATDHPDKVANPSMSGDASRIYISQKAEIDKYFTLAPGKTGDTGPQAAIAIKSDDIRIIARNTIKIVTEKDSRLSANEPNFIGCGVQLIANNDSTNMQPIPRGDQLMKFIRELQSNIEEVNAVIFNFMEIQKQVNASFGSHTHFSPFFGIPTSPGMDGPLPTKVVADNAALRFNLRVDQGIKNNINNLASIVFKYSAGKEAINSSFHYLN